MTERISPSMIFIVTFLSSFFILIMLVPAQFTYSDKTYELYNYPDYMDKTDIEHIKYFKNDTLTKGDTTTFDFTAQVNFKFKIQWFSNLYGNTIYPKHVIWEFLGFIYIIDEMNIEEYGFRLSLDEALLNWDTDINASVFYPVYCDHISFKCWLLDKNKTRNNLSEAWNIDEEMEMGIGFGFDDISTTISAWDLVGRLLTLQAVEVGPWYLQLIINMPIYVIIAYVVYRLILLAIPFVGG